MTRVDEDVNYEELAEQELVNAANAPTVEQRNAHLNLAAKHATDAELTRRQRGSHE